MDIDLETSAAKEFERLFRLSEGDRRAAASLNAPASLQQRTEALLEAYDKNISDRFLEPATTIATEELQRWLGENANFGIELPADQVPAHFGAFEIIRPISQGDLCSIYLAEQARPVLRTAAIKVLHSTARRRETLRRFDTERQAIAAMRHPNIAQFYEAGASDTGHAYFAMEYVDGPQITAFCVEHTLALRDRIRLFLQVCSAIVHAHQRGILHRDLKPSNILVAFNGAAGSPQAKVIDFGVSKAMEAGDDAKATMTGQVVGTLAYMSPEQLRGDAGDVDTRADVFSLGLVLFEMLAGSSAFPAQCEQSGPAPLRRAGDPPARLRTVNPELRGDLDTIVAKATALDPELRYPSVADFANDLERFLNGRPVLARNPGVVYIATKFVKRNWIASSAAVLVLGAGAFAGMAVMQARVERSDLVIQFAQAVLENLLATQRTIGESPNREPQARSLAQEVRQLDSRLPGEPQVRSMLASAVTELGYVNLAKGRHDEAQRNFDEALAIRRELAAIGFGRLGGMGDLSLAMIRSGDAASARGDSKLQAGFYREAFEIDERAADLNPNDRMALSNLGWSCERLAVLLDSADRTRLDLFNRQLEIFSRLNSLGATADSEHGLTSGYSNLALTRKYLGMPFTEEAQQALAHARAAVALVPHDRHLVRAALKAKFIVAETLPDQQERAKHFLSAIRETEAFCDQDRQDTIGEEQLFTAALRCDEMLAESELDPSTFQAIREAKKRIESRLATSIRPTMR
ncbi:MAG: serine/threonine-protein kinase [Phycisphaerales bacterium]|nr:serine/threonine protein kinase [Planctomycetota bacterium]